GRIGKLLAYAIAGHHAGLANGIRDEREDSARRPLQERLKDGTEQARAALSRAQADGIELPTVAPPVFRPSSNTLKGFQLALFGRMLFSCLVDADFLETERFYAEAGEIVVEREKFPPLPQLLPAFDNYLSR